MTMHDDALRATIRSRLDDVLTDACFPALPGFGRGKTRDFYTLPDGRTIMVATDRQSAFDQVLAAVPFKGQVLTATALAWFEATADILPNHVIECPDPNITVVRRLTMLPVEMVVRDYLTGSTSTAIWPMYQAGQRAMYGLSLPDDLRKNDKLPETVLTPTSKGNAGTHDVPLTPAAIIAQGLMTAKEWDEVAEKALALFARGRELAARRGLILVDTKYEFGRDANGTLTIADEIHTPDSSRYWIADSYAARHAAGEEPESLDKEFLRLWIAARCDPYKDPIPEIPSDTLTDFSARYIRLYEAVTGKDFVFPSADVPVRDRVHAVLKRYVKAA